MSNPIAVCISDIHFNLTTLPLASQVLRTALAKAEDLKVPLVIAGDLNDSKAVIRSEVAKELLDILLLSKVMVFILVGNHDLNNEKGEGHSLEFLNKTQSDNLWVISEPCSLTLPNRHNKDRVTFIPYQNSQDAFKEAVSKAKSKIIICHQGFLGAQMGDYVQDKTSVNPEVVKDFTVISGHYHRHQTLGTVTYIGTPFTMTFGEANDGAKGYLILNEDGSYAHVELGLRRHIIIETPYDSYTWIQSDRTHHPSINSDDLLWVKITGPRSELNKINKIELGNNLLGHSNYKLDLIPTDSDQPAEQDCTVQLSSDTLMDSIIDKTSETDDQKTYLKQLWRDLV
jgi:DNA repair exonuclease SbcCD nuclease subunit